ncbi:hypothetical protein L0128_19830 [candidate division KSB1 bacterium]|nr:hypothetical protein [candidate division KSB1 bacterium]
MKTGNGEPRTCERLQKTLLALATALITVGYQTFRAAYANPVDSLRYE